jgi:hypothetical protein
MSGHKPFRAVADRVTATPEGRERVETYRRLMDAVPVLINVWRYATSRG